MVLAAAALLLSGVFLSKTSSRLGVPSLLLFLGLGMVAGPRGLGIEMEDVELVQGFGVIALAFILFSGGMDTQWPRIRPVLAPGVALASVGVVVSAVVLGWFAAWVLDLDLAQGMLLGAIISSTDAAAVFSILRSRGVALKGRLRPLLELESGSNDPAAVFLTVGIIGVIEADGLNPATLAGGFVWQMGLGALAGWGLARATVWVINRVRLDFDGLYPVLTVAFVLLTFEGTTWFGGSGFLATYVAGVTLANSEFLHKRSLSRFHDALAWLMQISMFVLLGLLVFPSELPPVALQGMAIGLMLMLVARPVATAATLLPLGVPWREAGFISWVGLRGASPIILATFPIVEQVDDATTIFNVVFFVVLTSVLLQGTSIPRVARLFGVEAEESESRTYTMEAALSGHSGHDFHEIKVPEGSGADGFPVVRLELPAGALIVLLQRGDDYVVPEGRTILTGGDRLLVLAEGENLTEVRRIVEQGPTPPGGRRH
jgi:potassium/hydrogen antiporter